MKSVACNMSHLGSTHTHIHTHICGRIPASILATFNTIISVAYVAHDCLSVSLSAAWSSTVCPPTRVTDIVSLSVAGSNPRFEVHPTLVCLCHGPLGRLLPLALLYIVYVSVCMAAAIMLLCVVLQQTPLSLMFYWIFINANGASNLHCSLPNSRQMNMKAKCAIHTYLYIWYLGHCGCCGNQYFWCNSWCLSVEQVKFRVCGWIFWILKEVARCKGDKGWQWFEQQKNKK